MNTELQTRSFASLMRGEPIEELIEWFEESFACVHGTRTGYVEYDEHFTPLPFPLGEPNVGARRSTYVTLAVGVKDTSTNRILLCNAIKDSMEDLLDLFPARNTRLFWRLPYRARFDPYSEFPDSHKTVQIYTRIAIPALEGKWRSFKLRDTRLHVEPEMRLFVTQPLLA